jgi:ISXO2-like transposase domain/Transposase zinc-ribbon domain
MGGFGDRQGCVMASFPTSLPEFQARFMTEADCAGYLAERRWPDGFCCPRCGHDRGWALRCKAATWECASCGRQTSVTAGTVLHGSKLPLTTWFWAAFLMATHSNGISALQLGRQLKLGYKTAWLLCAKLRCGMVDPDRTPLDGVVEIDETLIPCRSQHDPIVLPGGRSLVGKMAVVGAVEARTFVDRQQVTRPCAGRVRLRMIDAFDADTLQGFVHDTVKAGATVVTDGLDSYTGLGPTADWHGQVTPGRYDHQPWVVGRLAAHVRLPLIHRVFANFKRWALGVYHGLRRPHLTTYL